MTRKGKTSSVLIVSFPRVVAHGFVHIQLVVKKNKNINIKRTEQGLG